MKKYIAVDIGGTAIKYGVIDEKGVLSQRQEMPTEAFSGGPSILKKTIGIVENFLRAEAYDGICISTAGMVDTQKGEIFHAASLIPEYAGTRFKETLEHTFGIPCEVENDVNCAGLAEYRSGAGKGADPMLMLTIGTGIGGCLVIDGKVFHGFGNMACEIGYMHMRGSSFQALGAASTLVKKVAEKKQQEEKDWNGYRIFQEAELGDSICISAIDEMADILGMGIANICYVVSPRTVVLGGGIMAQEAYLKDRILNAVKEYLIETMASRIQIAFAKHGNDAGMLGAFYHFTSLRNNT